MGEVSAGLDDDDVTWNKMHDGVLLLMISSLCAYSTYTPHLTYCEPLLFTIM